MYVRFVTLTHVRVTHATYIKATHIYYSVRHSKKVNFTTGAEFAQDFEL